MAATPIALDTNILVRYLAQDDPRQSAAASKLIESLGPQKRAYLSLVTILETVWVMEGRYGASRREVRSILEDLLKQDAFEIQEADGLREALGHFARPSVDLHDALILCLAQQRKATVFTFDKKAAKQLGMQLLSTEAFN